MAKADHPDFLAAAVSLAPADDCSDAALLAGKSFGKGRELGALNKADADLRLPQDENQRLLPQRVIQRHTVHGLPVACLHITCAVMARFTAFQKVMHGVL